MVTLMTGRNVVNNVVVVMRVRGAVIVIFIRF